MSALDRMPASARQLVVLRRGQGATIAEIRDELAGLGFKLSVACVGKHTKRLDDRERSVARRLRAAEALADQASPRQARSMALINVELMHGRVLDLLAKLLADGADPRIAPLQKIAATLANLAAAQKALGDLASKAAATERQAAADRAGRTGRAAGLSDDALARIRAAILGLPTPPASG